MPRALRLLVWLQFRGSLRLIGHALRTPKGIAVSLIAFVMGSLTLLPLMVTGLATSAERITFIDNVEQYFPIALFAYLILMLMSSFGSESIYFSQEEVENLFTAPFTRRQLLVYKLWSVLRLCLVIGVFMSLGTAMFTNNLLCSYVGMMLTYLFITLFPMLLTLVGQISVQHAFNRRRKFVAIVLLSAFTFALVQTGQNVLSKGVTPAELHQWVIQFSESTVGRVLLAPFAVFGKVVFAHSIDLSFLGWTLIAFAINAALVVGIVLTDANYLAVVERTSKKVAELQKNVRASGGIGWRGKKEYVRSLPMLPFWKGMGPIIWRQVLVTIRISRGLILLALVLTGIVAIPMLIESRDRAAETPLLPILAMIGCGYMTMFFSISAPVGFRPDIQRMEVFKSLPHSGTSIAMGQLLGSVLLLSFIQMAVVGLLIPFSWKWLWIWGIGLPSILPINYLCLAVSNAMLLLIPVKTANGPKDFAAFFQGMLSTIAVMVTISLLLLFVFGIASLVFLMTSNWVATVAVAAAIAIGFCFAASIGLVFAYNRFDVSLHSPS